MRVRGEGGRGRGNGHLSLVSVVYVSVAVCVRVVCAEHLATPSVQNAKFCSAFSLLKLIFINLSPVIPQH